MRNCPALALVQPQEISNLGPSQRIEPVSCEDPHATRDHHNADNASNPKPEQAAMTPTRKYPVNVAHLHGCTRSPFPTACKHLRAALSRRIHRHATHANTIRSASGTNLVPKPPRRFLFVAWGLQLGTAPVLASGRNGQYFAAACRTVSASLVSSCVSASTCCPPKIEAMREREAMTTTTQNQWRQAQSTTQQKSEKSNRRETK